MVRQTFDNVPLYFYSILSVILIAFMGLSLHYGITAYKYQNTEDILSQRAALETRNTFEYLESQLVSNFTVLDMRISSNVSSLQMEIDDINTILGGAGGSTSQILDRLTGLENSTIQFINTVPGDPMTNVVNLVGSTGIDVTDDAGTYTVTLENTGVVTVNGVSSNSVRNLELLATGMIDITNDVNASAVTVDGSSIVTTLVNLQNEDSMQAMSIMTLQTTTTNLQNQLNAVEMAGQMIAEMLNGTQIEVNMTIMELIDKAMMNEARIVQLEEQLSNLTTLSLPVGTLVPWAGTDMNVPDGYLLADGTEYSDSLYPDLFMVVGTMYCDPSCAMGMFSVPDMRGRVPVGMAASGTFMGAVGTKVGTETHTLTTAQIPAHTHSGTTGIQSANHVHQTIVQGFASSDDGTTQCGTGIMMGSNEISTNAGLFCPDNSASIRDEFYWGSSSNSANHQHTFTTSSIGSGSAHPNVQPSLVMHYMIKT